MRRLRKLTTCIMTAMLAVLCLSMLQTSEDIAYAANNAGSGSSTNTKPGAGTGAGDHDLYFEGGGAQGSSGHIDSDGTVHRYDAQGNELPPTDEAEGMDGQESSVDETSPDSSPIEPSASGEGVEPASNLNGKVLNPAVPPDEETPEDDAEDDSQWLWVSAGIVGICAVGIGIMVYRSRKRT